MTTNQIKGLNRNTIDKFYTDLSYANKCIEYIKKNVEILKDDLIIEPSAGNGSFMEGIKSLNKNCKFYDIEPENEEIIKQDYLLLDISDLQKNKVHIVGNPPFGRQASLAIKFIKKSCEFAESISFILPKSFKKDSMRNKFNENFHLLFEEDVPINSFIVNGKMYDVPCVFQIWKKQTSPRVKIDKLTPQHFEFVKIDENPDISFRRVGVYAGKIDTDTEKSEQSHYFIKFTNNKSIKSNLEKLKAITFNFNNTVGPRSISKQELIKEFDKFL